ncbi:MAG: hypothetical protein AB7E68_04635 [Candidatus Babeliales bacterium]
MTLKKITLAALLAAYSCGLPLQAMEINPFKKTGIPTMDQHGTLVKVWETGIQKVIQHNSFIRETFLPGIRKKHNGNWDPAWLSDANPEIQQLGKEAQEKLEIPLEQQVPIKLMYGNRAAGYTTSMGIFVQDFNNRSINRFVLFHEAAHRKYWDDKHELHFASTDTDSLLGATGNFFLASSLTYLLISNEFKSIAKYFALPQTKFSAIAKISSSVGYLLAFKAWRDYINNEYPSKRDAFVESRADYTAFHALDCHKCISESSELSASQDSDRGKKHRERGYFLKEDMEIIAEKFRKENKICDYHAQQKNITQNL